MTKVNPFQPAAAAAPGHLQSHPLFADLAAGDLDLLIQGAALCEAEGEQHLFHEGDPAHHYYLVQSGEVEVLRFGLDGEDRVFGLFGAGQLVAIAAMFMPHGRYPMHARCREQTRCLRLERQALNAACLNAPALAMRLLRLMSATVYRHVNEVEWLTTSSAPQRLALYLLKLSGQEDGAIHLPLSQRQLASRLGVRAETLSRLLADWQARGYVAGRGREWSVQDKRHLQELAHGALRAF